jgi:hypothetical protein
MKKLDIRYRKGLLTEKDFTGRWKVVKYTDGYYDLLVGPTFLVFKPKTWIDSDYISVSSYEELIDD